MPTRTIPDQPEAAQRALARRCGRLDLADAEEAPPWGLVDDNAHPKAGELAELLGEETPPHEARAWILGRGQRQISFHDNPKSSVLVGEAAHMSEAHHGVRNTWVRVPGIWELDDPDEALRLAWDTLIDSRPTTEIFA